MILTCTVSSNAIPKKAGVADTTETCNIIGALSIGVTI